MKNLISNYWKMLTDINERGIYRRDEYDINLLTGKKNSEYPTNTYSANKKSQVV